MDKVKNQHFVPRCYLRNFANKDERINVFDKEKNQIRVNQKIDNIASSRFFYDIDLEEIDEVLKKENLDDIDTLLPNEVKLIFKQACEEQFIEKWFSEKIEPELKNCINNLEAFYCLQRIENIEKSFSIIDSIKKTMSVLIVVQIIRSKEFRVTSIEQFPKIQLEMIKALDRKQGKDLSCLDGIKAEYKYPKACIPLLHARMIMDEELIFSLAEELCKHIWYIGVNRTNKKTYTSDNPIIKIEHKFEPIVSNGGIASPGIEIVYPLSNDLFLIMKERVYHKDYEKHEMKYKLLSEDEIEIYNYNQVIQSYRCVFSSDNSFELANRILKSNPSLSKINRMRTQIL
ncbi:DUF4238 domain-containing protein [Clostridium botulinum]|nr:DUF4238 domain-containing protein [Clostridium botulinum]NFC12470.1 DUF4238 domain-containing protein [Clostridium botulinum]NFC16892.1 DUF4238 domain-containing protein [Clostridium botulinum]NFC21523.1 DUF4238 domain-containing protein [Clostridium botulinum]NFC25265.1 DUF4238 domain-containing protein [Clostridium botulinum]